jgi:preprotein translocase subunit SecE
MASKPEEQSSPFDVVKMVFALLLLTGGVAGYYYFADQAFLYRVLGMLALILMALGVMATTATGQRTWHFLRECRVELRKMVWPSRGETVQTTLSVFVMVLIVGIFLWLLDMLLGWAVQFVIA